MGVKIADLFQPKEIDFPSLTGKVIAVDASNHLYQFLTTIRGPTGELLTDNDGNVTSHLIGLLARTSNMLKHNMKIVYVFDGKPPELKRAETRRRSEAKKEASAQYEAAKAEEDVEEMRKYASRTTRLTKEMVEEAKTLLHALGIPILEAPSEAEAQAAFLCKQKDAHAVASQDADALLFGSPRLIRNLSVSGKKKKTNTLTYQSNKPELILLDDLLNSLNLNQEQLISLSMLVGTDYNMGGIKGLGPQKALKLVKEHKTPDAIFSAAKWDEHFEVSWQEVQDLFTNPQITKDYSLDWHKPDPDKIKNFLCGERGFSEQRVDSAITTMFGTKEEQSQTSLGDF